MVTFTIKLKRFFFGSAFICLLSKVISVKRSCYQCNYLNDLLML